MKSLKNKKYTFKCPKCLLDKIDNEGMQNKQGINPLTPKIELWILPSSFNSFPCKLVTGIWW